MGVNVKCTLPADVQVRDAAEVMGILAGLPMETKFVDRETFGKAYSQTNSYERMPGVAVKGLVNSPTMADIILTGDMIDGEQIHFYYWHFEGQGGTRSFGPKSTAFWIAICKGLVDFFGGELVYNDCSDSLCDYKKSPRYSNDNEGGRFDSGDDLYDSMQERKHNLKPLTLDDLKAVHKYAAYQTPEIFEKKEISHV